MGKLDDMMARLKAEAEAAASLQQQKDDDRKRKIAEAVVETRAALAPVRAVMEELVKDARRYAPQCQVIEEDDSIGITLRIFLKMQTVFVSMEHSRRELVTLKGESYPEVGLQYQLTDIGGLEETLTLWAARLLNRA